MIVRWLDGEEQVFPWTEGYWAPLASDEWKMERIEKPREAARVARDVSNGHHSISRAASTLGTTKKQIRAWLRSGRLKGTQEGGKWVHVDPTSIQDLRGTKG